MQCCNARTKIHSPPCDIPTSVGITYIERLELSNTRRVLLGYKAVIPSDSICFEMLGVVSAFLVDPIVISIVMLYRGSASW